MILTTDQQQTIKSLEEKLSILLWEDLHYGDTPNEDVVKLFREGVELNFKVSIQSYMGVDHPEYQK